MKSPYNTIYLIKMANQNLLINRQKIYNWEEFTMLGLFFGKKNVQKISLQSIASQMSNRFWNAEMHESKSDTIVIHGKYRNREKDFKRLMIHFLGDQKIEFKDERGNAISHIPTLVEQDDMYNHVKNIMNVI